ncbi:MBL fold metallo-hydrolase [bacterium]|nr:MBL fold metallo-hydrolase [bacterium]
MRVQRLEPDVHLAIGDAYDSNSTILVSGSEAILIEAMASKKDAEDLKKYVETDLKDRVRYIICTHYFSDHLAGLKFFPESQIITHKNYRHTFDQERYRSEEEKSFFAEPTILISDELSIRWGRFRLNLFYNPGHTMSTVNVDIPQANLIHVGDTVVGNMVYISYSTPALFFPALEQIKRRNRKTLISSHLAARSTDAVDHALYYLRTLQRKAKELDYQEETFSKLELQECLPEGVKGTPFETIFHKRNLKIMAEQRFEDLPDEAIL